MRVAMLTRAAFPLQTYGGLEKFVYYLSKSLVNVGIDVTVVTSSDKSGTKEIDGIRYALLPPLVKYIHFKIPHLVRAGRLYFLYFLFNVAATRYLERHSFDILHSYEISAERYLHLKKRSPTIVQAFDNEFCKIRGFKKIFARPLVEQLRYCMVHSDAIAAEGKFQIEEIEKLFNVDRAKIITIPVGVDLCSIESNLSKSNLSRRQLGLDEKDFVIVSVNRFSAIKGINYLVEAFNVIKEQLEEAKLMLIGVGPEEGRIKRLVHKFDLAESVIHLRNVEEHLLYNYYHLADVYVSPTLHDDSIMSILEAMACELPIVSTGQNFIVHSRRNGYVVPKKDKMAIANAILEMYDKNECKKMGKVSRKIVIDYDWAILAKKAITEYERLVS